MKLECNCKAKMSIASCIVDAYNNTWLDQYKIPFYNFYYAEFLNMELEIFLDKKIIW